MKPLSIRFALLVLAFGLTFCTPKPNDNLAVFKTGDRICFIGNSITHGGAYHAFLQAYCATRFPSEKVEYYNCGIAGDVAGGMIKRFEEDIMIHRPTHAFLMTGMNDIQRSLYENVEADEETLEKRQAALDTYYAKTEKLAVMLLERGVKPIFMTPSIYDQTSTMERDNDVGTNDALVLCANHIKALAKKYDAPVVDLNTLLLKVNAQMQALDPKASIVGADRIHPGTSGHFVMAYEIMRTISPAEYISKLRINARKQKVLEQINCDIEFLDGESVLEFKMLEKALPFPVKEALQEAMDLVPFQSELDKEWIAINALDKGNYKLLIDEIELGVFSSMELKEGINLANYANTPQAKQAADVYQFVFDYHKIQGQLRNVPFVECRLLNKYDGPDSFEAKKAYLDDLNESQKDKPWYNWHIKVCGEYFQTLPRVDELKHELIELRSKIYSSNQPQWHTYKLVKL